MSYKNIVKQIQDLRWQNLGDGDLQRLMVLSGYSALEFAKSLRLSLLLHPENHALQEMAREELQTDNLTYGGYQKRGDHADFLWHFIRENELVQEDLRVVGRDYMRRVDALPDETVVMSIVSREQELPGIFTRILTAPRWQAPGLPEFKYYLQRHIALDSAEGGHADMLRGMPVDDRLIDFYRARLDMYRSIPALFSGEIR